MHVSVNLSVNLPVCPSVRPSVCDCLSVAWRVSRRCLSEVKSTSSEAVRLTDGRRLYAAELKYRDGAVRRSDCEQMRVARVSNDSAVLRRFNSFSAR